MRRHLRKGPDCELDTAPMIDMVFLLLIFFMCSATMQNLNNQVELELPKVQKPEKRPDQAITPPITISAISETNFMVNAKVLSLSELTKELKDLQTKSPKADPAKPNALPTLILRIDKAQKSKVTKSLLRSCASAGLPNITLSVIEDQ